MTTFGWPTRLKFGLMAAAAGWLAAWTLCFPFELSLAWRYVDGNVRQLPSTLAKGLVVWGGFSFFMAMAGFLPLMLPLILLAPPAWVVRLRRILIPAAPLVALLALYQRMGFLHTYYYRHPREPETFFFTAPDFFVITFALVAVWTYVALAKGRLLKPGARGLPAPFRNRS
jgi:hypothetical protein